VGYILRVPFEKARLMPHNLSAAKRHRQNEKRRLQNKDRLTELKTLKKKVLRAVHDQKPADAETLFREFTQRVDQAAQGRTVHPNAANRLKSRLAAKLVAPAAPKA
jgi:small subunit ribosomal protein S20